MLKNVLSLLLSRFYSKKESELVGHQAMPSNQYTRLVSNGTIGSEWTAQAFSGIAAYDGYLFFAGTSTSAVPIVGIASSGASSNLTFPWLGARLSTTIPVTKGASWTVQGSNMEEVIIDLTPTIGGGYHRSFVSAVCKRGELCRLKALSLFLPRSSFRTNPNGSAAKHIHQRGFSSQTARQNTFLQGMVTWVSTSLTRAQITALIFTRSGRMEKSSQEKLLDSQLARAISLFQVSSPLRKVIESLLAVPSQRCGSHRRWGANSNLFTGGALC